MICRQLRLSYLHPKANLIIGALHMAEEKRRFTRIHFRVKAEMTVNDVLYRAGEISNLSVGGCLLPVRADLEPGSVCHIRMLLSGTSSELSVREEI